MRIATWNINGLNARLDFLLHWLASRQPDVVALQELKMTDDRIPTEALTDAGYHVVTHGQKSWNGVAVLSKAPAEVLQVGLPGQAELGARLLTVRVDGVVVTSVYCPNGKTLEHADFPRKLAWFEALAQHLPEHHDPTTPAVLTGDFNVCPTPLDSWRGVAGNGRMFQTEAERSRFARLLEHGFVDTFRALHPDEQSFSWWDYRGGAFHRKQGLRIDFVLATPPLAERLEAAVIDREYRKKQEGMTASDHAPVWAEFAE